MSKRGSPIDRLRSSAGSFTISSPGDQSAITHMFGMKGGLILIKELGIYRFRFADNVDPERANPDIPNSYQKILDYGSSTQFVSSVFLTAHKLFRPNFLPREIESDLLLRLALEMTEEVAGMADQLKRMREAQESAIQLFTGSAKDRNAISLPTVPGLVGICKHYFQRADHSIAVLLKIITSFYPDVREDKQFTSLREYLLKKFGERDPFLQLLDAAIPMLRFLRNARNCIEHPKENHQANIRNFELLPDGKIGLPSIEVIHPETGQPAVEILPLMETYLEQVSMVAEQVYAHLASKSVQPIGGLEVSVVQLAQDERAKNDKVRFAYAAIMNGRHIPFI